MNPLTWLRTALLLRREKPDAVIFVWWVWVWALPYLVLLALLPKRTRVILQCHNIGDKEPAAWKRMLTNLVLRRGDVLVVHAKTEAEDAARRARRPAPRVSVPTRARPFLPGPRASGRRAIPVTRSTDATRETLGPDGNVALFFGHVRPFKGLDIALRAWRELKTDVTLVVAGEAWWKGEEEYRALAQGLHERPLRLPLHPRRRDRHVLCRGRRRARAVPHRGAERRRADGVPLRAARHRHERRRAAGDHRGRGATGCSSRRRIPRRWRAPSTRSSPRDDRATMERHAAAAARKYSWEEYGALIEALAGRRMKFSPSRIKVGLELTSKCNLRCGMCPLPVLRRPYEDMDWPLVEKAEREIHGLGLKLKWLHEMGEPLLYSRIDDAIRLFPEASLSTNGLVLTPEVGAKLLATPLKRIRICVDSINPKVYPQLRTGGDFDKLVDLTRKFLVQAKGAPMRIEIQKMRSRLTLEETVDDFRKLFDLKQYKNARVIEKTCEALDVNEETDLHGKFYGCVQGAFFTWVVVFADGRVTHCCYDAHGDQVMGDLKTHSLREIIDGDRMAAMQDAFNRRDFTEPPALRRMLQARRRVARLQRRADARAEPARTSPRMWCAR